MTSDKTIKAGLFGENIGASLSPYLHKILADEKGIKLEYGLYENSNSPVEIIEKLRKDDLSALNLTKPYKQEFFNFVDEIDIHARKIRAINTLSVEEGRIFAYNTDFVGIYQALLENDQEVKDRIVVVLGAGGAARSAVYMAAKYETSKIIIVNRTLEKAKKIADDIGLFFDTGIKCFSYDEFRKDNKYDDFILINATSVGMKGFLEESILDDELIDGATFYMDMIYSPHKTMSMDFADKNGLENINGLDMLFFQGLKSFEIWTGLEFSVNEWKRAYRVFKDFVEGEK